MIFCLRLAGETGRGVLIRVKSGGVASVSSARVVDEVPQVSVSAKLSLGKIKNCSVMRRIYKRVNIYGTSSECWRSSSSIIH